MKNRYLYQVDAFTTTPFTGNPAGVVFPADGLDEETMLNIARELNNSETAFIFTKDHGYMIRFFTAKREVPLCTHATIASYHILATQYGINSGLHQMECQAGNLTVELGKEEKNPLVLVTQAPATVLGSLTIQQTRKLGKALGLQSSLIRILTDLQPLPAMVSTGNPKILVSLPSNAVLSALTVNRQELIALGSEIDCPGFYCYTLEKLEAGVDVHARMFSPGSGIDEDPVTGNAAGALAYYLGSENIHEEPYRLTIAQGEAMGRKGYVKVSLQGRLATIQGHACTVFETSLML